APALTFQAQTSGATMKIHPQHAWDLTPERAAAVQTELAGRVQAGPPLTQSQLIAGADVSYDDATHTVYAGVVVVQTTDWAVVERQGVVGTNTFPYVPGLLSFREMPVLLEGFTRVQCEPDLVMCDGQGRAHPRRFGLACHVGLWLDRPCLGAAKTRYRGEH